MMDLFTYPQSPGFKARQTSADAAADIAGRTPLLREQCLAVLRNKGALTPDQVAGHLGISILSVRPRFSELVRLGKIQDTGERRVNQSGRRAICWRAA